MSPAMTLESHVTQMYGSRRGLALCVLLRPTFGKIPHTRESLQLRSNHPNDKATSTLSVPGLKCTRRTRLNYTTAYPPKMRQAYPPKLHHLYPPKMRHCA